MRSLSTGAGRSRDQVLSHRAGTERPHYAQVMLLGEGMDVSGKGVVVDFAESPKGFYSS